MSPIDTLGARLLEALAARKISQAACAEAINASSGFVSDVVRGIKIPGGEFLYKVRREYGISVDWLLSGEGDPYCAPELNTREFRLALAVVAIVKASIGNNREAKVLADTLKRNDSPDGDLNKEVLAHWATSETDPLLAASIYSTRTWRSRSAGRLGDAIDLATAQLQALHVPQSESTPLPPVRTRRKAR